jgi:integrase
MPRMQDIDKSLVEGFLQDVLNKPPNPHTVNDKRDIVASLFNYAVDNDWLVKSVVKKIRKLPEPESNSPDPLNQDEVIRVLDGCKKMDEDGKESVNCFYEIMATIFYAGLRASEVTNLFPTDLDFKQGRILRNKKIDYGDSDEFYRTKTKLHWFPPINDTLEAILKDWLKRRGESSSPLLFPYIDGGSISVDYLFKKMKGIMERANFAPDRMARPLHRGRHTFACPQGSLRISLTRFLMDKIRKTSIMKKISKSRICQNLSKYRDRIFDLSTTNGFERRIVSPSPPFYKPL